MLPLILSPLVLSSDSHLFEPPDLWQTRIDAPFRDRAPRIQRIDGAAWTRTNCGRRPASAPPG